MSRYIATFHTHLSALLTCQSLTAELPDDDAAEMLCADIREMLAARAQGLPYRLSASIGYVSAGGAANSEALLAAADAKMYRQKRMKKE